MFLLFGTMAHDKKLKSFPGPKFSLYTNVFCLVLQNMYSCSTLPLFWDGAWKVSIYTANLVLTTELKT